jgi:hypothetical protein
MQSGPKLTAISFDISDRHDFDAGLIDHRLLKRIICTQANHHDVVRVHRGKSLAYWRSRLRHAIPVRVDLDHAKARERCASRGLHTPQGTECAVTIAFENERLY